MSELKNKIEEIVEDVINDTEEKKEEELVLRIKGKDGKEEPVELNKENCIKIIISYLIDKVKPVLSLQQSKDLNRALRFLENKPQLFKLQDEEELDEEKSVNILTNGIAIGNARNVFSFDECSILYYIITRLAKFYEKEEKDK